MAFMGTVVVNGRAKGVVVATGGRTVLGQIAADVQELGVTKAPLQEKIERFARNIGVIVLVASALLFLIGILVGESAKDMFMTAVAAAVAAIYTPALQWVFRMEPIGGLEWLRIGLVSVTVVIAVEIDKWLRRMKVLA